jgi:hypothetical protein
MVQPSRKFLDELDENERRRMVHVETHPRATNSLVPRSNPDAHGTILDGEMVLLNLTTGRYYTLNLVGAAVWEQCTGEQTLDDIHEAICARFDVSIEQAAEDIVALVMELEAEGLLSIERR